MALTDIIAKIDADADAQVAAIIHAAHNDAAAHVEKMKTTAIADGRARDVALVATLAQEERAALSRARQTAARRIAQVKRELVDDIYEQVLTDMEKCDDARYAALLTPWIVALPETLASSTVVYVATKRSAIMTQILVSARRTFRVVADDTVPIGCVVRTVDADYDLTIARRLADCRAVDEHRIATILFDL